MKIANIRLMFAANSSSTHSIVFGLKNLKSVDFIDGQFYRNEFVCADDKSKRIYLACQLISNLNAYGFGEEIVQAVIESWLGFDLQLNFKTSSIDHQSVLALPLSQKTEQISKIYFQNFRDYVLKSNVAIVGGSDESENFIELTAEYDSFLALKELFPVERSLGSLFARKDGEWWVLFNTETGSKVRLSFSDKPKDYVKATYPELIDVKITDFCPYGCEYCYQNSTKEGKHASFEFIEILSHIFKTLGVFEVALGGGEPTLHNEFVKILNCFAKNRIKPNFTTFNVNWLSNSKIVDSVQHNVGRFAVSVDSAEKIKKIVNDVKKVDLLKKLSFHHVLGSVDKKTFTEMIQMWVKMNNQFTYWPNEFPMIFLGYKISGRGNLFTPISYNWLEIVEQELGNNDYPVGIDTKAAQQMRGYLTEKKLNTFVTYEEGKFGMYIDAVNALIGPSSYCDEKEFVKITNSNGSYFDLDSRIAEIFAKF